MLDATFIQIKIFGKICRTEETSNAHMQMGAHVANAVTRIMPHDHVNDTLSCPSVLHMRSVHSTSAPHQLQVPRTSLHIETFLARGIAANYKYAPAVRLPYSFSLMSGLVSGI